MYGRGTKSPNKDKENVLTILDISGTIACVKCMSGDYVDYMQMVNVDGQWKILNLR